MGHPLVHIQVCHSCLLFAGAENVSKTRAKGKNSGRKVAKQSKGKETTTDSLKTKKPKTKGIHLNASTDIICRITLRYKSCHSFF